MDAFTSSIIETVSGGFWFMASFLFSVMLVFLAHELGHYIAARLCRVHVERFTIGYGRKVWERTDRRGTRWIVNMFPVCGFIHLFDRKQKQSEQSRNLKESFSSRPLWQRIFIVLAGPMGNIVFAFTLFLIFFAAVGQPSIPPFITGVEIDYNADKAGFEVGDRILEIEGKTVRRYEDVLAITKIVTGIPLSVTLQRGDRTIETEVISEQVEYVDLEGFPRDHGRLGVVVDHRPLVLTAITSVQGEDTSGNEDKARDLLALNRGRNIVVGTNSVDGTVHYYRVHLNTVLNQNMQDSSSPDYHRVYFGDLPGNFFVRSGPGDAVIDAAQEVGRLVSGVFQIVEQFWPVDTKLVLPETQVSRELLLWKMKIYRIMYLTAFMSICIALINLLPIAVFDGGVLVTLLAEVIAGPAWAEKTAPWLSWVVLFVLYSLLLIFWSLH